MSPLYQTNRTSVLSNHPKIDIKKPKIDIFKNSGLFDKKTLESLKPVSVQICKLCKKECGTVGKVEECNHLDDVCLSCFDNLYDNHTSINNEMFKCPICEISINSVTFLTK
jgi:hypothetical protein